MQYIGIGIAEAAQELQNAENLIVAEFPNDDRSEVCDFVKRQFNEMNLKSTPISARAIFNNYCHSKSPQ